MSDFLVMTPAGEGRLMAVAQVLGGWHVHVRLSGGGNWAGPADELLGAGDQDALAAFRRSLGDDPKEGR